jgi:hypothetical protein
MRRSTARPKLSGFLAAVVAGAAAAGACDWRSNGLERLEQLNPPPGGADGGSTSNPSSCALPDMDGGTAPDPGGMCLGLLNGNWAGRMVQFGNISILGTAYDITITDLFLVALSEDKSSLELTFCDEESSITDPSTGDPFTFGATTNPPALISALAAAPISIPLPGDGSLHADPVVWLWGLGGPGCGSNPYTSPGTPLPAQDDTTATCVWDQDMDGNPGVTVDVASPSGSRYMVRRAVWNIETGSLAGGWMTGPLQFTVDQSPMGANPSLLDTPAPITPRTDCTSLYQMRCAATTYTCQNLIDQYQVIFQNPP